MGAYTAKIRFGNIAVIAENLKFVSGIAVPFEPVINIRAIKPLVFPVRSSVVVNMVNAQKSPVVNATTSTLSAIGFYNRLAKFSPGAAVYCPGCFGVFFSPRFCVRAIAVFILIIVFQIIRFISLFLTSFLLCGIKFFTHRIIVS